MAKPTNSYGNTRDYEKVREQFVRERAARNRMVDGLRHKHSCVDCGKPSTRSPINDEGKCRTCAQGVDAKKVERKMQDQIARLINPEFEIDQANEQLDELDEIAIQAKQPTSFGEF